MKTQLTLGIVGHTNTGKTSLIRTLLRNSHFGDVRNEAGTTRHVESALLPIDQTCYLELRDTPGLEDSSSLWEYLQKLQTLNKHHLHGRQCLQTCIDQEKQTPEFEQEIKVLQQALQCQLLLYVIDCRDAVFAKYLDEISILQMAAIPILPVLNFIQNNNSMQDQWKASLAQLGLHAYVAFDTVAYTFDSEKRLYRKLQTLLESHYGLLQRLIEKREQLWEQLLETTCHRVAQLLVDVCKLTNTNKPQKQTQPDLQDQVRALEQQTLSTILHMMRFDQDDIAMYQLPVADRHWQLDLFSPETLKLLGLDTASAAAAGATLGAGLDLVLGGLSLGAATATGAAIGATWHTSRRFGKKLYHKFIGQGITEIDDLTLDILLLRQLWLLQTVFHRGHAAENKNLLNSTPQQKLPKEWPSYRNKLRTCALEVGSSEEQIIDSTGKWIKTNLPTSRSN